MTYFLGYCLLAACYYGWIKTFEPWGRVRESFGYIQGWDFWDHVVFFVFLVPIWAYTKGLQFTDWCRITKLPKGLEQPEDSWW